VGTYDFLFTITIDSLSKMRKILLAFLALFAVFFFSANASAFEQTNETCYGYCAAHKLYWSGDPVWRYITEECSMDEQGVAKVAYKLIKGGSKGAKAAFDVVAQAIMCAGWINHYIAPMLDDCQNSCNANIYSYAPDPTTRGYSEIVYSKNSKKLILNIYNHGHGYAENIDIDVYAGSTTNRDCEVTSYDKVATYQIPELAPMGANRNDLHIPYRHNKEIALDYEEDECNKIKVIIDPYNTIPELGEESGTDWDNEYIIGVNDLPTLPGYYIENFDYKQLGDGLDDVRIWFDVKNSGEMIGWPSVHVKPCGESESVAWENRITVDGYGKRFLEFDIYDLDSDYATQSPVCLEIIIEDEHDSYTKRETITVYSAEVQGAVYDMYGEGVSGATVTMGDYTTTTDSKGKYKVEGISQAGDYTLTATSPEYDVDGTVQVNLTLDPDNPYLGLNRYGADVVLMDGPATISIRCPYNRYIFELDSGYYNYRGGIPEKNTYIPGIVPGEYTLRLSKDGYTTSIQKITVEAWGDYSIDCGLHAVEVYQDDSGIQFSPRMHDLWTIELRTDGTENPYYAEISDDGGTVVILIANPRPGQAKALIYSKEGQKLGEFPFAYRGGQLRAVASMSYDGSKILIGNRYILSKTGQVISENPDGEVTSDTYMSHDGSLFCHIQKLYDTSFEELSGDLVGSDKDYVHCPGAGSFDSGNKIIGACKRGGGICRSDMGTETMVDDLGGDRPNFFAQTWDGSFAVASAPHNSIGSSTLYYLQNDNLAWQKEIASEDRFSGLGSVYLPRLSVSPGGGYIVGLSGPMGMDYNPYVFDSSGDDLLNLQDQYISEWCVFAAKATGTGIYYIKHTKEGMVFGVLGTPGVVEKQQVESEFQEMPEWEAGGSIGLETAAAIVGVSVFSVIMLYYGWRMGMFA